MISENVELVPADVKERLSEEELLAVLDGFDGIICGDDRITRRVLDSAPRLKVISKWGARIDSIDSEAARERGIPVFRTPNAFSEPVADTVLGYILLFARRLSWMDRDIRGGRWQKPVLRALNECVLGVVGVGDCGKAVVRRALAFGMRVLGNDIVEMPPDFLQQTSIEMVPLKKLLGQADFVSLNTDLNPTSFHLIGTPQFECMQPDAYLINTSRGPVVDEKALPDALQKQRIAGAALDVEATLVEAQTGGTWRFELGSVPGFRPETLRVVARKVVQLAGDAVVFRVQGRPGDRVVFSFRNE